MAKIMRWQDGTDKVVYREFDNHFDAIEFFHDLIDFIENDPRATLWVDSMNHYAQVQIDNSKITSYELEF